MKKRLILSVIIILSILVLIIGWSLYVEIYVTYNGLDWIKVNINHEVDKALESHTRENIFYKIPYINNKYWIFTTLSHGVNDKHSIKEIIDNKIYFSITFGVFDIDNNILYFYEYDR